MNRLTVAIAASLLVATPAFSADSLRRIRGCMIKRMTADKLISYNDAKRACLDQLVARVDMDSKQVLGGVTARTANGTRTANAGAVD